MNNVDIIIPIVIGASVLAAGVVIVPTVKFAVDLSPFLYANTKCSVRTGLLLKKKFYDELLSTSYVKELYTMLEDSCYAHVVEHVTDFSSLSRGLDKDLYQTYVWLKKSMPKEISPIIAAIKLRFEIDDLKRAINNIKRGKAVGELEYVEDESLKLKLEDLKDLESFAGVMETTIYKDAFTGELTDVSKTSLALDVFYHKYIMKVIEKIDDEKATGAFKEYWKNRIDLVNIRVVLRKIKSKKENIELIEGGFLGLKALAGINEVNQLESALTNSPYSSFITETSSLGVENGICRFLKSQAGAIGAKHTLRSGSVVKYIILKELEIRNLNIICKLKEEDFKAERIQKLMVV